MNMPELLNTIELLRMFKSQKNYSNADLTENLTAFGWTWVESYVADLLAGKKKPTAQQNEYIKRFLLDRYYGEELAA
ncbi:hypothetical protein ES703_17444 [subsurface metagenome]